MDTVSCAEVLLVVPYIASKRCGDAVIGMHMEAINEADFGKTLFFNRKITETEK
jgi:hypothetical protein